MPEERVRIELGFAGGQIVATFVEAASADELESALGSTGAGKPVVVLETEDGPLHVVVAQVAYYKRIVRAGRVGFGSARCEREAITGLEGQSDFVQGLDGYDIAVIRLEAPADATEEIAAKRSAAGIVDGDLDRGIGECD